MNKTLKRLTGFVLVCIMMFSLVGCGEKTEKTSKGEEFPTKPVTIVVPWGVGGGVDVFARKVASYGEKYLGQPVIVENRTGGAGTVAMTSFVGDPDDGYTMIAANGPLFSLTPNFQKVQYSLDDITPLIGIRTVAFVALTNPEKSGLSTIEDIKAYSDAGNTIKYATTGGPGNDGYTVLAVLFEKLGVNAEAVPFDGGLDAINALVGGHVDVSIGSPPVYAEYVKSGQLVSLGTFVPETIEVDGLEPQLSFREQGIDMDFTGLDYFAVRSSVDTEKQEVLTQFIKDVYADPEFQEFMKELDLPPFEAGADELLEIVAKQTEDMNEYVELIK
ncbi:tripartite tricarboxylate transporter substrate binding protein [Vallitalea okinawensis]|uniref:tripartite tricarboxylate transporter substrate binding protein n=1 Tax=Vallitalea okinawensis TaxID=2078660 RepID=UPI000CFACA66|nr:tripartite tricarboxylate transporter substrate binding protein [Vallitalea okinawensis]